MDMVSYRYRCHISDIGVMASAAPFPMAQLAEAVMEKPVTRYEMAHSDRNTDCGDRNNRHGGVDCLPVPFDDWGGSWQAWIPVYPSCRVAWEKSGKNHKEEAQSLIPSSQSQFRVIWRYTIPEISAIIWAASASLPEKSRIMTARR